VKADYDSEANALLIRLREVDWWDDEATVHDTYCHVGMRKGRAVGVELLDPGNHLDLLTLAAERFSLDPEALLAAARAALAAPDRPVSLDVEPPAASAAA
jgi:hypothetical protein